MLAVGSSAIRIFGLFAKGFDARNIKPEDLGQSVKTDIFVYYDNIAGVTGAIFIGGPGAPLTDTDTELVFPVVAGG